MTADAGSSETMMVEPGTSPAKGGRKGPGARALAALGVVVLLALAACGNGGGTDTGTDVADTAEYCELARQLDDQDDFPSEEQLREVIETAPEEIAEDAELVIGTLLEGGPEAFGELMADPERREALERIEAFEAEECGIERGDEEQPEGVSRELDPDAQRVDVSATEYDFTFDAPSPGPVSFVMTNDGEEAHFMLVTRLAEGVTLDEAMQADEAEAEELAENVGDSDVAGPGEEAVLTVEDLEAGTYGMLCFIPAPDGEPHAFKGMAVEFTVE